MSKRIYGNEYGFQTRAVHTGKDVDSETGSIKRPITMANSYELPYDPSELNWSSAGKNLYTRNGGSNQQYLQERLASLEGGEDCVVLASGVAALSGLFFALLESGAIIGQKKYLDIIRAQSQVNLGGTISPFNAWLIMRGSVTLPLRMKQHNENAMKAAEYLETVKGVSFVAYPGLR
ncbi:MAG: PLP-dependent transferase [Ruminococcus sp.]